MRNIIYCVSFLVAALNSFAQEINPKSYFVQDTMELAAPVQFSLSVSYPSNFTLLFPDSSYNFAPFEYRSKEYFTTKTDSLRSKDSVVFTLASFEIDPVQKLKLPVFVVRSEEQIPIYSNLDSIFFQEKIGQVVDSLQALQSASPIGVKKEFNYPYLIIALLIFVVLVIIVALIFGKKIVVFYKLYLLKKRHEKFLHQFKIATSLVEKVEIDQLYKKWKLHLEYLTKRPFSRLTTKEIFKELGDELLNTHLQSIDRFLYSSKTRPDEISADFVFLTEQAIIFYQDRIKQLQQNGAN
ncbi:MAG: hypothetical protein ACJAT1_001398 [Marivirga sp.]|jgi:hypothetical protein